MEVISINKEYYTVKDICDLLNLSHSCILKYIDKGCLKTIKTDKGHLIHKSSLEDFKINMLPTIKENIIKRHNYKKKK